VIRTILNSVEVTETGTEPVTLTLTKSYLGIASEVHDALLTTLITSARKEVEMYCKMKFIACNVKAYFESINEYTYLPYSPVNSIISVKDKDDTGVTYELSKGSNPKLKLTSSSEVIVEYTSGLAIEEDLRLCIIKKVGEDFEYRTGITLESNYILPNNWMATALKHRTTWLM
jgi:hypothetical protein